MTTHLFLCAEDIIDQASVLHNLHYVCVCMHVSTNYVSLLLTLQEHAAVVLDSSGVRNSDTFMIILTQNNPEISSRLEINPSNALSV